MAASFIPRRLRPATQDNAAEPSWLRNQVTNVLQQVSRRACAHPIHTIAGIALLASTTYVGLLEGSIFDALRSSGEGTSQLDTASFLDGSRNLRLGEHTAWRWQSQDNATTIPGDVSNESAAPNSNHMLTIYGQEIAQHLALATFVFPDSSRKSVSTAPLLSDITIPANVSAHAVPHTPNVFAPFSHDSSVAFTVPFESLPDFLTAVQEIPDPNAEDDETEQRKWIMKAARSSGSRRALKVWVMDAWSSVVDLIKVCCCVLPWPAFTGS